MLVFLKKIFKFKNIDLEAKLFPTDNCTFGGVGEIEFESFSDGEQRVELTLKHSGVPDHDQIEFFISDRSLATVSVTEGRAKKYIKFNNELQVQENETAEIRLNNETLYRGTFRKD